MHGHEHGCDLRNDRDECRWNVGLMLIINR